MNTVGLVTLALFVVFTAALLFVTGRLVLATHSGLGAGQHVPDQVLQPPDAWFAAAVGLGAAIVTALASRHPEHIGVTNLTLLAGVTAIGGGGLLTSARTPHSRHVVLAGLLALGIGAGSSGLG